MKKIILILTFLTCASFAQTGIFASAGRTYHGLVGVEQTFMNEHVSANLHWLGYNSSPAGRTTTFTMKTCTA